MKIESIEITARQVEKMIVIALIPYKVLSGMLVFLLGTGISILIIE
jgi:hypothetical protein